MAINILGISAYYHDSAAVLVRDGKIIAAAQEERFTRKKHDAGFPLHAIRYCLEHNLAHAGHLDFIVFYEKPLLTFERLLETYIAFAPHGLRSFVAAMPVWLQHKLFLKHILRKELSRLTGIPLENLPPLLFTEHHQAHAAAAFFPSPFENAAVLCLDGVGEWATTSVWLGQGNRLIPLWQIDFPHSLGLLYSAFTSYIGFRVNSGEYKMMGLAPHGEPRYVQRILDNLIDVKEDGTYRMDMRFFNYASGLTMTSPQFDELFGGPPRRPENEITRKEMDIACSIQRVTEEIVLRLCRTIRRECTASKLCLAGGVALNCVANRRVMDESGFGDVWVQPAPGDAGGALGAALAVYYQYLKNPRAVRGDSMEGALLGPHYSDAEIIRYLQSMNASFRQLDENTLLDLVAEMLAEQKVVGWFQGRMEFGPRALGSRSILADPRDLRMQSRLNQEVKRRESFRPFAPAVKWEQAGQWFTITRPELYMTSVSGVRRDRSVPAVTHVDGSARVQTVHYETNPRFHRLLDVFEKKTGCPLVVNTSFNVRGEPIVCTPEDAYHCFMGTGMEYLVMGDVVLEKSEQPAIDEVAGADRLFSRVEEKGRATTVDKGALRTFGLVIGALVAAMFGLIVPVISEKTFPAWPWFIMMVLWFWAVISPLSLRIVYTFWCSVGHWLGWLNNRIILSIIYFMVFCPVGMVFRVLGRDSMARRFEKNAETYRVASATRPDTHVERPF